MKRAISVEAIRGIPMLNIAEGSICGECQVGKQTRMSHPRLEHYGTSKVLELLHMDLIGLMQVSSIKGKRYVLVVVDDSKCYVLADRDYRRKMDPKSDEGIIMGYSTNSRAYTVYNSRTQVVMESINVVIDDLAQDKVPEVVPGVEAYAETSA